MRTRSLLVTLVLLAAPACATYRDELLRSQQAVEQGQHDRALALLRDLEPDMMRLPTPERAQYAYLRGITDYRIGHRADARHWLSIARAYEDASPGVLPTDWKGRTNAALDEMNQVVQSEGHPALAAQHKGVDDVEPSGATGGGGAKAPPPTKP